MKILTSVLIVCAAVPGCACAQEHSLSAVTVVRWTAGERDSLSAARSALAGLATTAPNSLSADSVAASGREGVATLEALVGQGAIRNRVAATRAAALVEVLRGNSPPSHTGAFHLRRFVILASVIPATSIGSAQAQSPCPLEDPVATSWLRWVLESDVMEAAREDMQLSHLQGQQLRVLGSDIGDEAICSTLYSRLSDDDRAALEQSGHSYRFIYYQVGDRYIRYYTSSSIRGVAEIEVFDMQFNLLARELSS